MNPCVASLAEERDKCGRTNQNWPDAGLSSRREDHRKPAYKTLLFDSGLEGAKPGQFVMVWLPGVGEKPFSIAAAAPLALTISDVDLSAMPE